MITGEKVSSLKGIIKKKSDKLQVWRRYVQMHMTNHTSQNPESVKESYISVTKNSPIERAEIQNQGDARRNLDGR